MVSYPSGKQPRVRSATLSAPCCLLGNGSTPVPGLGNRKTANFACLHWSESFSLRFPFPVTYRTGTPEPGRVADPPSPVVLHGRVPIGSTFGNRSTSRNTPLVPVVPEAGNR